MTSENANTTLEEEGRNPFNVMLNPTAKDLLVFFNGFQYLHDTKREINKKLKRRDIKKEDGHYCWSGDDIKQAWKETQGMDTQKGRRKHWSHVIMLQMLKIFICEECKENAAQEESGVVSESQLTTSSTDTGPRVVMPDSGRKRRCPALDKNIFKKSPGGIKATGNYPFALEDQHENKVSKELKNIEVQTTYIKIPFTDMFGHVWPTSEPGENSKSKYKLIDAFPSNRKTISEGSTEETDSEGSTDTKIKKRKSYFMSFDKDKNNAIWVYEILNMNTLSLYKTPAFIVDNDEDGTYLPSSGKKKSDEYERGHLAAAANHKWCQEAYKETYYLSNITPQVKNLNRGLWKRLEYLCRKKTFDKLVRNVHVYTGPLYLNGTPKCDKVLKKSVPTDYFKVIIVENNNGTVEEPECYLMPNDESEYKLKDTKEQTEDNENNKKSEDKLKDTKEQTEDKEKKKEEDKLKKYKVTIQDIESKSNLQFTVKSPELRDYTKTVTCTGNNRKKTVTIDVRISEP